MTSGVGAIQAEIAYHYRPTERRTSSVDFSEMNLLIDQHQRALRTEEMSDHQLIEEFNRHLKSQRDNQDIQFKKYEQHTEEEEAPDSSDEENNHRPLEQIDHTFEHSRENNQQQQDQQGGILQSAASLFGLNNNATQQKTEPIAESAEITTDDDTLKSFPILDAIGSWTMAKETNQVLRTIGKLLVAFVRNTGL
jgi:hypothetical protein